MREGFTQRHKRDKEFVLDLGLKDAQFVSPREIEQIMNEKHPIFDRGSHGRRLGSMSIKEFLEKFG